MFMIMEKKFQEIGLLNGVDSSFCYSFFSIG